MQERVQLEFFTGPPQSSLQDVGGVVNRFLAFCREEMGYPALPAARHQKHTPPSGTPGTAREEWELTHQDVFLAAREASTWVSNPDGLHCSGRSISLQASLGEQLILNRRDYNRLKLTGAATVVRSFLEHSLYPYSDFDNPANLVEALMNGWDPAAVLHRAQRYPAWDEDIAMDFALIIDATGGGWWQLHRAKLMLLLKESDNPMLLAQARSLYKTLAETAPKREKSWFEKETRPFRGVLQPQTPDASA